MAASGAGAVRHWNADVNGISLHVAEQGPAAGPAVLLLHGFPELWLSWRHQMAALAARGFRALAPDLRGFGDSDAPADPAAYTLFHVVGDLVALLVHLRLPKVFVVGHDWGALVAWHLCLFRPDLVRAAVTIGVPLFPRGHRSFSESFAAYGEGFYVTQFQTSRSPEELKGHSSSQFYRICSCTTSATKKHSILFFAQTIGPEDFNSLIMNSNFAPNSNKEPGRAERAFARHDVAAVLKKFFSLQIDDMVAPPGVEFIDFLEAPSSSLPWMSEEELGQYAEKFQKSGFTGPLNYYRMMDMNWMLTAPWQGAKITVPVKFIAPDKDVGMRSYKTGEYIRSEAFRSIIPDLEVVVVEGHHFIQQEQAERVSSEILSYFGKFTGDEI